MQPYCAAAVWAYDFATGVLLPESELLCVVFVAR
jgi:hypothetical protein